MFNADALWRGFVSLGAFAGLATGLWTVRRELAGHHRDAGGRLSLSCIRTSPTEARLVIAYLANDEAEALFCTVALQDPGEVLMFWSNEPPEGPSPGNGPPTRVPPGGGTEVIPVLERWATRREPVFAAVVVLAHPRDVRRPMKLHVAVRAPGRRRVLVRTVRVVFPREPA